MSDGVFLWLITLFSDFFFLELFLNYTEKVIELIIFLLDYWSIYWKEIFV